MSFLPDLRSFRTRLVGGMAGLLVLLLVAWAWRAGEHASESVESAERARLAAVVQTLAPHLDGDALERATEDIPERDGITAWADAGEELGALRWLLLEAQRANGLETPLYIGRVRDERRAEVALLPHEVHEDALEFTLSTSETPYWRHAFDYRPEMRTALYDGRSATTGIYHDEHGGWISAYAPIRGSRDEIVGFVEADMPVDALVSHSSRALWAALQPILIVLLVTFVVFLLLATRVGSDLSRLERAAEVFGQGDVDKPFQVEGSTREIVRLADALEGARVRIRSAMDEERRLVTALEEARDAAETAVRTKSNFLANMSHELRTPLNGVLGSLELLYQGALDHDQRDLVGTAGQSAQALLRSLDQILEIIRLDAGERVPTPARFGLRADVSAALADLRAEAEAKGLLFRVLVGEGVPEHVEADVEALRDTLVALVRNAVKFTESGAIEVRIRTRASDRERVEVLFEVIDTGIGIAPAERERMFELFSQADETDSRRYGGTGLGLAICRRLVELLYGEIGVDADMAVGSRFWFTARLARCEPETADEPLAPLPRGRATVEADPDGTLRILIVEDNPVNQRVVQRMLQKLGYDVEVTANGQEAIDALDRQRFAGILMDCQMPVMDGYEATARIRDRGSEDAELPIIALTAHASPENRERALGVGMDDFLAKPVRIEEIRGALERWITQRR